MGHRQDLILFDRRTSVDAVKIEHSQSEGITALGFIWATLLKLYNDYMNS